MQEQALDGHMGRSIAIDICHACQSFWFDAHESVSLTPGSTLQLFKTIGEHVTRPQRSDADLSKCPRCKAHLRRTHDMQRTTKFEYLACPNGHGRLTTFFDFLREKDFIRPLTPQQIADLRRNVKMVNCRTAVRRSISPSVRRARTAARPCRCWTWIRQAAWSSN